MPWYLLFMRQIIKSVLKEYTENLSEGSKRVKLHPRTEADLEYLSQVLWTASKKGDDEPPKKGTVMICPADFTHTHRGNPPLTADKYIITTWVEFIE